MLTDAAMKTSVFNAEIYWRLETLAHMLILCLTFWRTLDFTTVAVPLCTPPVMDDGPSFASSYCFKGMLMKKYIL